MSASTASETTEAGRKPETESKLRDFLLDGLSSGVPGKRTFHLHVVVGAEQRTGSLFPYASVGKKHKVRVGVKKMVVLLSEEKLDESRVMTCGIEAAVYRIPETFSGILYISKVDSTGHGRKPNVTGLLVRRFVKFFVEGGWMSRESIKYLWVHVFARAQGEYLFLGSKEWKGKRVLGDVGLCGWWKRCLGEVGGENVRRWYLMAGLNESEAEGMLGEKGKWEYGHGYGQKEVRLPCPYGEEGYLGRIIPYFEDDPKSRFLDELEGREIGRVGVDEFWERMGFRQECVAGAITGFYTVLAWREHSITASAMIGKPRRGEVSDKTVQRVIGLLKSGGIEFSTEEKAERATEVVESTVKGLCDGMYYKSEEEREKTPERKPPPIDLTPNPFSDPVPSLDTYYQHIYTSTTTTTTSPESIIITPHTTSHVTKLVPRRKIK